MNATNSNTEGEDERDEDDFLTSSLQLFDAEPEAAAHELRCGTLNKPPKSRYNGRKPKWWRQQSLKPSKKLKQVMRDMQDTFCVLCPPYGEMLHWGSVFADATDPEVWIEIGFGLGDNLLCLSQQFPERCLLGSEVHARGVATTLQRMQSSFQSDSHWTGYTLYEQGNGLANTGAVSPPQTCPLDRSLYDNLRIYRSDITKLLPYVPEDTVHAILVTFPDPFPSGEEWRLLQADVIAELHRVLVVGGRLYLATDHTGHFEWCIEQMALFNGTEHRFGRVDPTPDRKTWLPVVSKYEQKGWDEGRGTLLACWDVITS